MDVTLELVDQLRKRADVSYEEAKAVLEEANGSLLDALILLEQRGKIRSDGGQSARYSTRPGDGQATPLPEDRGEGRDQAPGGSFWGTLYYYCTANRFEVVQGTETLASIPIVIFILLILLAFWISVPLLLVGLLFGCRYRFTGPGLDSNQVNQAVNQAAGAVGDAVSEAVDWVKAQAEKTIHNKQSKQ